MSRALRLAAATVVSTAIASAAPLLPAQAATFVPISGAGSTWSQNAVDQWRRNVNQYGLKVNYAGTGSSDGRNQFRNGTVDFAVTEIPYGTTDGGAVDQRPNKGYAYMPIVAGGTAFMYNLKIGGKRVTNLRLSGPNVAAIFTGKLTQWNDPKIKADNPGLSLPARRIVPVVRSDGSGTTAQFSTWLSKRHTATWDAWCKQAGRSTPCGTTSNYPVVAGKGFVSQAGSLGVSGYVAQGQSEGAITYVEYSYALNLRFPVAKVLNSKGYYVEPTASNVAVALLRAKINENASSPDYLTQDLTGVYDHTDARAYPLSSYSYMVVPTALSDSFNAEKGKSLGSFGNYFLCQGQQEAEDLGYSPLPINLVEAGLRQVKRIPGVEATSVDIKKCNNPTFSASGENTLAKNAPQPPPCDKQGATQCTTGGGTSVARPVAGAAGGGSAGAGTGAVTGGTGGSGAGTTGGAVGGSGTASGPLVPGAVGGGQPVIDPETGEVIAGPAAVVAGEEVSAVAVQVAAGSGVGSGKVLMVLAGLLLLGATIAPPLLSSRLSRGGSA